jgi:excisionase family DNA binding protein
MGRQGRKNNMARISDKPATGRHGAPQLRQAAIADPGTLPQYITCKTAAEMLKMSEITIRRMLTQKRLRRYKVGSRTLLRLAEVLALVHEV